jgi:isopenicillin-N synthase
MFNEEHELIKANKPLHEINKWPDEEKHKGYKEFIIQYYWKTFGMCKVLLRGFSLALGKNENFFDEYFNSHDTMSSLRLIRYPYIENYPPVITAADGTKLNFDTHRDVSLLTVLYQPCIFII